MSKGSKDRAANAPVAASQRGVAVTRMQWLLAAVVVVGLVAAYWYFTSGSGRFTGVNAPATSKEAVPEAAREVISEQQQVEQPDYAAALEQARSLRAEGKLADAQLLYFYAARGGYMPAAFELAELYDPLRFDAATSLMDKPDPFQAFKWYTQALKDGNTEASSRLNALHQWAQQAAEQGDLDAEQLLLQWQ